MSKSADKLYSPNNTKVDFSMKARLSNKVGSPKAINSAKSKDYNLNIY